MSIKTNYVLYEDQTVHLEGFVASSTQEKQPAVILCHAWGGRDSFICEKAQKIAHWGYVGFALDMYGKGILGKSKEENYALKHQLLKDRDLLQKRVLKAFEVVCALPNVDATRIVALGFGFGGICALDLARSGVNLKGAISVYGHFRPPPPHLIKRIKAKILILHGYNDPVTPFDEVCAFAQEMDEAKVDWQLHLFGNTMHAFATPSAQDPESGIFYNPISAKRSWNLIQSFLNEVFYDSQ